MLIAVGEILKLNFTAFVSAKFLISTPHLIYFVNGSKQHIRTTPIIFAFTRSFVVNTVPYLPLQTNKLVEVQ